MVLYTQALKKLALGCFYYINFFLTFSLEKQNIIHKTFVNNENDEFVLNFPKRDK